MSFFSEVTNTKPYLKASVEGFQGSGKTFTANQLAIELARYIKTQKPVAFFDTEKAAHFLKPFYDAAGVKMVVKHSRSLKDLKGAMDACRAGASDILIIDSVTHVWESIISAHLATNNRQSMQIQDWSVVNKIWQEEFLFHFVNDNYHIISCGRAGYEYEDEINEKTKRRQSVKSSIKMRAQKDTEFDGDLSVLMEQDRELLSDDKSVQHTATILKDRSTFIHGKTFTFKNNVDASYEEKRMAVWNVFKPHIDFILSDANYSPMSSSDDRTLIKNEENNYEYRRSVEIQCEEIEGLMKSYAPGQTTEEKKARLDMMQDCFGTRSWTAVTGMELGLLQDGAKKLAIWINDKKNPKPEEGVAA